MGTRKQEYVGRAMLNTTYTDEGPCPKLKATAWGTLEGLKQTTPRAELAAIALVVRRPVRHVQLWAVHLPHVKATGALY